MRRYCRTILWYDASDSSSGVGGAVERIEMGLYEPITDSLVDRIISVSNSSMVSTKDCRFSKEIWLGSRCSISVIIDHRGPHRRL